MIRSPLPFFLALTGLFFFLVPAFADEGAKKQISIGALMPLTGEFAMQAAAFREGIELAEEKINASGALRGKVLRVIIEDTRNDLRTINSAARKLVTIDRVVAAVTTSYPETEVGGKQFQHAKIPSIALWDSSPDIDAMGDYIFAIGPWTPSGAEVAAEFAKNSLSCKSVAVVNTVEPWSELIADIFEENFKKNTGKVFGRWAMNPGDSDFRSLLTKIRNSTAQCIYAPLTHEVIAFHKLVKQLGVKQKIISADIITQEHVLQSPDSFEGVYQTGLLDPLRPETELLAAAYRKKYGREWKMPWFVSTGYDSIQLLAQAIGKKGTEGEALRDFLYTIKDFPGAAQSVSISAGGSSPFPSSMFVIHDGRFVLAKDS